MRRRATRNRHDGRLTAIGRQVHTQNQSIAGNSLKYRVIGRVVCFP